MEEARTVAKAQLLIAWYGLEWDHGIILRALKKTSYFFKLRGSISKVLYEYSYSIGFHPASLEPLDLGQGNTGVGAVQAFDEALLGLLKVDDIPDGVEVLDCVR